MSIFVGRWGTRIQYMSSTYNYWNTFEYFNSYSNFLQFYPGFYQFRILKKADRHRVQTRSWVRFCALCKLVQCSEVRYLHSSHPLKSQNFQIINSNLFVKLKLHANLVWNSAEGEYFVFDEKCIVLHSFIEKDTW